MGRSPCCDDKALKKGPWTPEEDRKLVDYIHNHGHGSWRALPKLAGLNRCGKSCRLRWTNYLRPDIKRGKFSDEEEQIIIDLHSLLGNKWSRIAAHLPGRTDNEIKNQWNTHLRKKLLQRGIDPKTHKPLSDLNSLANLSQLLSSPSLGNLLMNPWDYYAFSSEVAQIQLLQSIVQLINPSPFHNLSESLLLGVGPPNIGQYEGVSGGATTTIYNDTDHPQAPLDYPNLGLNGSHQLFNNFPVDDNSVVSIEGGFQVQPKDLDSNYDAQIENKLPALVSASVESSTVNQLEMNVNSMACPSPHSPTSNFFEGWEKFLDDEANAPWKDILS